MKKGIIKADPRATTRSMRAAIQGDIIRGLVELITNADDSYTRQESREEDIGFGKIEIQFNRVIIKGKPEGHLTVKDFAEGMSYKDFESSIIQWGSATSGLIQNIGVRGYFGRGAKDVLASMKDGKIISIHDEMFTECRLFIKDQLPQYELEDSIDAKNKVRKIHGLKENGTVAYFIATQANCGSIPLFKTIRKELSNNHMLRKIMMNPKRTVILKDLSKKQKVHLEYKNPIGRQVLSDKFEINFKSYNPFSVSINIFRSDYDLTQLGDDRDGGLLIIDDNDMVLDISLFKYDNEVLANRLFGEVIVSDFRNLLINEEPVLSDKRDGIEKRHPFCSQLVEKLETYICELVEQEEQRRKKEQEHHRDSREQKRFKAALNILNRIAKKRLEKAQNLSTTGKDVYPKDGLCLYPESASVSPNKKYRFELRFDTKVIHPGTRLDVSMDHGGIIVRPDHIFIEKDELEGVHSRNIYVEPQEPDISGTLSVESGNRSTNAKIMVLGEKEERKILFEEGLLFEPESLSIRPSRTRKAVLKVYTKIIPSNSEIILKSDNPSIQLSTEKIVVNEFDAKRHIASYEVEVLGVGVGQEGLISAEYLHSYALLAIKIRSKKERDKTSPEGMFSEPEFNEEQDPLQPSAFSRSSGKVVIYTNWPLVKHYLGDNRKFSYTLTAQMKIAEIVCERCFNEMARIEVETSGVVINPDVKYFRIQQVAHQIANEDGLKVLKALVDQRLLRAHQSEGISQSN